MQGVKANIQMNSAQMNIQMNQDMSVCLDSLAMLHISFFNRLLSFREWFRYEVTIDQMTDIPISLSFKLDNFFWKGVYKSIKVSKQAILGKIDDA